MKLEDREWAPFLIEDLFETFLNRKKQIQVPTGGLVNKKSLESGNTPRITVKATDNGIAGYYKDIYDKKNYRTFNNFISVSFLGNSFYHAYKASLDMKVHCLKIKDYDYNKYTGLFISCCIDNVIKNSSYGNQLSATDIVRKKVLLPVDVNGEIDYKFMEDYIKIVMRKKYEVYLDYINF